MFADAYATATKFTRPVVIPARNLAGDVFAGVGSFVILNEEGWILTAHHIINAMQRGRDQYPLAIRYEEEVAEIQATERDPSRRRSRIRKLHHDRNWVRYSSSWWGEENVSMGLEYAAVGESDIALCKLHGLTFPTDMEFPRFKKPAGIRPGTSLMKLGYPFNEFHITFNEQTQMFDFDSTKLTSFPIDGIMTREVRVETPADWIPVRFVETSTPGLMGQSGGPTVDRNGDVWAIQSSTQFLDLGFRPQKQDGNRVVVEHQFLNVGWGVHTATIQRLLELSNVTVQWVD